MRNDELRKQKNRRLRMSRHASVRVQQRGLTRPLVSYVLTNGRAHYQHDGTCRYVLSRRDLQGHPDVPGAVTEALRDKRNPVFVLADVSTGVVITTGYQYERARS